MIIFTRPIPFALASVLCLSTAGCLFNPTTVPTRSFVLTAAAQRSSEASQIPIGVGLTKMAPYLMHSSIVIRKGTNEVAYSEEALWAERLDLSFQRALAANLSAQVPTDQIRLSSWEEQQVTVAVYANVQQFDVDTHGRGVLVAWWRVTSPDGNRLFKSGQSRLNRDGPGDAPEEVVATLSGLTEEFSQTLAQAIRESAPLAKAHK